MLGWALRTAAITTAPFVLVSAWAWWAPAGAATRVGEARIVKPSAGSSPGGEPLAAGSSTTAFTLALPTGASCRGDSANDGYRWQTYMVPESVDPATLQFGSVGPLPTGVGPSFRQPLFKTTSDPVVNQQTAAATTPPGPGPIVNIPPVDFALFEPGDVAPGTYNVGVACTKGPASPTQLDTFWNAKLVVGAGNGAGAAVAWHAPGSSPPAVTGGGAPAGESPASTTPETAGGDPGSATTPTADGSQHRQTLATSPAVQPSGAPPSLNLPVAAMASHLDAIGTSRLSVAVWAALLLLVARIAALAVRLRPALQEDR